MRKVNVDRKENDSDHTLQTIFLAVFVKAKVYDSLSNSDVLFNNFYPHALSTLENSNNEFLPLLRELQN